MAIWHLKSDSFSLEDVNFLGFFLSTSKIYNLKACKIFTLSKNLLQKGKGFINTEYRQSWSFACSEVLDLLDCVFGSAVIVVYCEEYFMYKISFGATKSWVEREQRVSLKKCR